MSVIQYRRGVGNAQASIEDDADGLALVGAEGDATDLGREGGRDTRREGGKEGGRKWNEIVRNEAQP